MSTYRMADVVTLLEQEARAAGVDPQFARAVLIAENTGDGIFKPDQQISLKTTSPAGAQGVGQVMPATGASLQRMGLVASTGNPLLDQVRTMVAAIKENNARTGGDPLLSAVHYNASFDTFKRFKESGDISVLPSETQQYLQKIGRNVQISVGTKKIPDFAAENMIAQAGSFLSGMRDNLGLLSAITGDTLKAGEDAKAAISDAAAATGKKINAEAAGKKAGVDQRTSVLSFFGIDRSMPDALINQQNTQAAVAQQEIAKLTPIMTQLKSVSFAEDPIAWIQAQVQLAQLRPKYNAAATTYNTATQLIAENQSRAASQLNLEPASNKAIIDAEAAAQTEYALANARLAQSKITQEQRTARLSELTTEMQWQGMAFNQASAMARLMGEHVQLRERDKVLNAEEELLANINTVRVKMGKEPFLSSAEFKAQKKETQDWYIRNANKNSPSIATTPGESLVGLYDENALPNFAQKLPEAGKFLDQFGRLAQQKALEMRLTNPKLSDAQLFEKAANEVYGGWRKELDGRNYDKLSSNNPYKMNARIFASAPVLEGNTVAAFVRELPENTGEIREKDVMRFAVGQLLAGKPKKQVAQEVRDFFEFGAKHQYTQRGMPLLGFDVRNPKKGVAEYPISGDVFGFMDQAFNPRLTNSLDKDIQTFSLADVERFLTLNAVKAKSLESAGNDPMAIFTKGLIDLSGAPK